MKILSLIFTTVIAFTLCASAQNTLEDQLGGKKIYPAHWGAPPLIQTRDIRELPGGYGMGSSTLANWITKNMEADKKKSDALVAEIATLENEIADMKDFMKRARFTKAALEKYKALLKTKEDRLATLKKQTAHSENKSVPTFEEWVKGGKKIPEGMVFLGGSPWFNEATGKKRTPEEVYKMLFKQTPKN